MFVDPIRLNQPPVIPDAVPARPQNTRPRTVDPSTPAVRSPAPALVLAQAAVEDVKVQWDASNGVVIKFTDKKSGAIVRQIPSEQILSVARFIRQMLQEQEAARTSPLKADSEKNHGQS